MLVCDEVCVWVVGGFPDDGEGSLRALLEAPNCMVVVIVAVVVVVAVGVVVEWWG